MTWAFCSSAWDWWLEEESKYRNRSSPSLPIMCNMLTPSQAGICSILKGQDNKKQGSQGVKVAQSLSLVPINETSSISCDKNHRRLWQMLSQAWPSQLINPSRLRAMIGTDAWLGSLTQSSRDIAGMAFAQEGIFPQTDHAGKKPPPCPGCASAPAEMWWTYSP